MQRLRSWWPRLEPAVKRWSWPTSHVSKYTDPIVTKEGCRRRALRYVHSLGPQWSSQRLAPKLPGWLAGQPVVFARQRRTLFIQTATTPNPNSVKFLPGSVVMENESTFDFSSVRAASASPLARRLFQIDGVVGVMFGPDFVTVTKREDIDWSVLRPEIFSAIMDFYMSGQPLFLDETTGSVDSPELDADTKILDTDPEHVAMIKELIETRIRPAVAEDGGSILYRGFEEQTGTVLLELQGACSSCASSSVTLKNGVENMLRHYVPEVKAVREVKSVESDSLEAESNRMLSELERQVAARQGATPYEVK
ncbi:hypothetical protein CCYA_CCYA02G0720 [Cyanidiococcus yangmingshanensis]|nr:hypothetical protein CCYA_CCYA02G0720 [Cyanidiococcus yangmingshanensis]